MFPLHPTEVTVCSCEFGETSPNLSKGMKEKGEKKSSAVNLGFFPPLEAFA